MADITHEGGSGWIPGCPCPQCVSGLAAAKRRHLRLVLPNDQVAGNNAAKERQARWANEPRSLLALAVALDHLVGEGPDPYACPLSELEAWSARYDRAAGILVEVANGDARVLRSLAGPVLDDDDERRPGRGLIILAAIRLERGSR